MHVANMLTYLALSQQLLIGSANVRNVKPFSASNAQNLS